MKPIVYIAGPYFGDGSYPTIDANIHNARNVSIALAKAGIQFFCPHTHTAHFETVIPPIPEQFVLDLDMAMLQHCHALFLLLGWTTSKGSQMEFKEAQRLGLPTFTTLQQLYKWHDRIVE